MKNIHIYAIKLIFRAQKYEKQTYLCYKVNICMSKICTNIHIYAIKFIFGGQKYEKHTYLCNKVYMLRSKI